MTALFAILKRIPVWLYVGLILGVFLAIQTLRLHFAQSDLKVVRAQKTVYISAQATNLHTIKDQTQQLAAWQSKFDAGIQNARATAKLAIASAIESANRATAAQHQLKVIYERSPASVRACGPVAVPAAGLGQLRNIAGHPH